MSEFKLARKNRWREKLALLRTYRTYLTPGALSKVNHLLLFTGYPRSGHTLVGALLDAHPNMVIAHQVYALGYLERGIAKQRVFQLLLDNAARFNDAGRNWMGYNYRVPAQWQGKYEELKIIGDKSGGITTRTFQHRQGLDEVDAIADRTGLKITFVHVIRNPYDMISTMTKRAVTDQGHPDTEATFQLKIKHFFKHVEGVALLKNHARYEVLDVWHEDLVAYPIPTISGLLSQLNLSGTAPYLQACNELVWENPKKSRNSIVYWTDDNIAAISARLREYPWFSRYDFHS